METPTNAHADTRRVPGWERVLDAFMSDPDRIRTNVELGQVPGVQAFHQRISDLTRLGYVLTSAVKLTNGRFAYALLGIAQSPGAWPHKRPRPYGDVLPTVPDNHDAYAVLVGEAVAKIEAKSDELTRRGAAPAEPVRSDASRTRAMRDAAATLAVALGDDVVGDWTPADRGDVVALAKAARGELARARSLRALEQANGEQAEQVGAAVAMLQEVLGDHVADWTIAERGDLLALTRTTCELVGDLRASTAELDRRLADAAAAPRAARRPRQPRADRGPTGPQLMRKALEHGEQPMHTAKIAAWVMDNGGADVYRGKTPDATMAAQLATSNKEGGEFVKVAPGCYGLREWATAGAEGGPKVDEFGNELLDLDPVR
jgi:hypothetical protein